VENKSESLRGKIGEYALGKNERDAYRNAIIYGGVLLLGLRTEIPALAVVSAIGLVSSVVTAGIREVQNTVKTQESVSKP